MLEIQNFVDLHSQNFAHKMRNYRTKIRREKKMMMMIALKYVHGFLWGWELDLPQAFWGVLGAILFNRKFRHGYFRFLNIFYDILIR
ncbi:hypothetical protein S83_027476 [Arachis hypogaea]